MLEHCRGRFSLCSFSPLTLQTVIISLTHAKYRDEIAILACVRNGHEEKYRDLTSAFFDWSEENCLILKTTKTKEMIVDFGKSNSPLQPGNIDGFDIEVVR